MKRNKNAITVTDPEIGETKLIDEVIPETEEEREQIEQEKQQGDRPEPMNLATNLEDEEPNE